MPLRVLQQKEYNLQESGYDTTLTGVKSSGSANVEQYIFVIVGGPIYAGKTAAKNQAFIET